MTSIVKLVEEQLDRAFLMGVPFDEVDHRLVGHGTFMTGESTNFAIGMNVPSDSDFIAHRFNLYISSRTVDQSAQYSTASESTFRPVVWTCSQNVSDVDQAGATVPEAAIEWSLEDTYNGRYNNAPVSIESAYSAQWGIGYVVRNTPWTAWPSGMVFDVPQFIRRGSLVTVNVTPMYSLVSNALIKNQMRVTAVLWGSKLVRSPA